MRINLDDIKEFNIKDKNIVSFTKVSAEIPLFSIFSKVKEFNLKIYQPKILLDESILKKGKKDMETKNIKIGRVDIEDGELIFNSPGLSASLVKFDLNSFDIDQNTTIFRFRSSYFRISFPFSKENITFGGELSAEVKKEWSGWKVIKFYWDTPLVKVNVNGRVSRDNRIALSAYAQGTARQILDPLLGKLSVQEPMSFNAKITKEKEGPVFLEGHVSADSVTFGGETLNVLEGDFSWNSEHKRIFFDLGFQDDRYKSDLKIEKANGAIELTVRDFSTEKFTRILDINKIIPIIGRVKTGKITIKGREFTGKVMLEKQRGNGNPKKFNVSGGVDFFFHSKTKYTRFSSSHLESEFGQVFDLKGIIDHESNTKLDIRLKATVEEMAHVDKYTTFFIDMPLSQWKLTGGAGVMELDVKKINDNFFTECDVNLRDFYSNEANVQSFKGHISSKAKLTTGKFTFDDPQLKGQMDFLLDKRGKKNLTIEFNNVEGESSKILKILDKDISLSGPVKGDFVFISKAGMTVPIVRGNFRSPRFNFYDFIFDSISGNLKYSDSIVLRNLKYDYMKGHGDGDVFIDFKNKQYNVSGKVSKIDLNAMNSQFKGECDLSLNGKGEFNIDPITFSYKSGNINFYKDQDFRLDGEGKILTDFSDFLLQTKGNIVIPSTSSPYQLTIDKSGTLFKGDIHVDIRDINLLIPWGNNKGELIVDGLITGRRGGGINTEGHATFRGDILSFPNFPHEVKDFTGDLIFKNLDFTLRSFRGSLGNGTVESNGVLSIKDNKLNTFFLTLSGKNMTLYPMDRTSFTMDADVNLNYIQNRDKLLISGSLVLLSGIYEREIDEGISFNTNASLGGSGATILDMLEYDLKMESKGYLQFNNSFGEGLATFDLKLLGNRDFPVITGVIESRKGKVNFSSKKFDLIRARLVYNNQFRNNPMINVESEAYIKNYRIKFMISGLSTRLKPELQSSPALPPRDILSLIAVGELFRRPTSAELSSQIGTGTTNLISSEILEQITRRTKKIFGNYLLRFEPNISNITGASVDTSRLIVGKEITKDFLVVYSTDFSTQRQQVIYLQYQLSPSISLIGMRNEDGRVSFDLRYRKRH